MSLNLVVPTVANLKIEWFRFTKSQKSSGSIAPLSKLSGSTEPLEPPLTPALRFFYALQYLLAHLCGYHLVGELLGGPSFKSCS